MAVYIPIPIAEVEQAREQPSKTYRLDLKTGRIHRLGSCDGLEAANQFLRKALLSPRFRCLIYDNQYGSEIKQTIIAADVTGEYVDTELPRLIRDACLTDSRILDVYDFSVIRYTSDEAHVKFSASTIFGETVVEEVI